MPPIAAPFLECNLFIRRAMIHRRKRVVLYVCDFVRKRLRLLAVMEETVRHVALLTAFRGRTVVGELTVQPFEKSGLLDKCFLLMLSRDGLHYRLAISPEHRQDDGVA